MRLARGPFWLGSISKLTRSPPASESKFTLESRPVRWKKYSRPSSAAMKPNPRSDTSFLMVPVGIYHSSSRKLVTNARPFREEFDDRSAHRPPPGDASSLPRAPAGSSQSQKRHADQRRRRSSDLQRRRAPFTQLPHAPHRDRDNRGLAHGRHHGQRRDIESEQNQQVAAPHEQPYDRSLRDRGSFRTGARWADAQPACKRQRHCHKKSKHCHEHPAVQPGNRQPDSDSVDGRV